MIATSHCSTSPSTTSPQSASSSSVPTTPRPCPPTWSRQRGANHPELVDGAACADSAEYCRPGQGHDPLAGALEPVPADAEHLRFKGAPSLSAVRRFAWAAASEAGLDRSAQSDLALSVNELAANSILHAPGDGLATIWTEDGALICQVEDDGRFDDPLAGRRRPGVTQLSGRGLWLCQPALRPGPGALVDGGQRRPDPDHRRVDRAAPRHGGFLSGVQRAQGGDRRIGLALVLSLASASSAVPTRGREPRTAASDRLQAVAARTTASRRRRSTTSWHLRTLPDLRRRAARECVLARRRSRPSAAPARPVPW